MYVSAVGRDQQTQTPPPPPPPITVNSPTDQALEKLLSQYEQQLQQDQNKLNNDQSAEQNTQDQINALLADMDQHGVNAAKLARLRALQAQLAKEQAAIKGDQQAVNNDQAVIDTCKMLLYSDQANADQGGEDSSYNALMALLAKYGIKLGEGGTLSQDDLNKIKNDPAAMAAYNKYLDALGKVQADIAASNQAYADLQKMASETGTYGDAAQDAVDAVNNVLYPLGYYINGPQAIDPNQADQNANDANNALKYWDAVLALFDAQVADDNANAQLASDQAQLAALRKKYGHLIDANDDGTIANDQTAITQADTNLQQAQTYLNTLQQQMIDQASPGLKKELGIDIAQQNLNDAEANLAAIEKLPPAQRRLALQDALEWVEEAQAQLAAAKKGNWQAVTQFSAQDLQTAIAQVQANHQGEFFGGFSASDLANQYGWEFAINQEAALIQSAPEAYLTTTEQALLKDKKIDIYSLAFMKLAGVSINNDADAQIAQANLLGYVYMKLGKVTITKTGIFINGKAISIDSNPLLQQAFQSGNTAYILQVLMAGDLAGKPYITLDDRTQTLLQNLALGTAAAHLDYAKAYVAPLMGGKNPSIQQQKDALYTLTLIMNYAVTPGERALIWQEAGAPYFTEDFIKQQIAQITGNTNLNVSDPYSSGTALDKIGEYLKDLLQNSNGSYEISEIILSTIKDSYNISWFQYVNSGSSSPVGTNFYEALSMAVQFAYMGDPGFGVDGVNQWAQWLTANDGKGISKLQTMSGGMDDFAVHNAIMDGYGLLSQAVEGILQNSKSYYAQRFNADYTYAQQDYQNAQSYLNGNNAYNNFNAKKDVPAYFNQFKGNPYINKAIQLGSGPNAVNDAMLADIIGEALGFAPTDPDAARTHDYSKDWYAKGTEQRAIIDLIIGWIHREGGATPTITVLPMIYAAPGSGVQPGVLIQIQTGSGSVYVDGLAAEQAVAAANSGLTPDQIAAGNDYQEVSPNADVNVQWHYNSIGDYQDNNQLSQSGTIYLPDKQNGIHAHNWGWRDTANVVIGIGTTLAFIAAPFTGGLSLFIAGGAALLGGGWAIYNGIDELNTMGSHGESTNPFTNGQAFSAYFGIAGGVAMAAMPFAGRFLTLAKFAQIGVDLAPEAGIAATTVDEGAGLASETGTAATTAAGAGKTALVSPFVTPKALITDASLASTFLKQYAPIIRAAQVLGVVNTGLGVYYTGEQFIGMVQNWDSMTAAQRWESAGLLGLGLVQMGISPMLEHFAQTSAQKTRAGLTTEFLPAPETGTAPAGSSQQNDAIWTKYGAWIPKGTPHSGQSLTVADDAAFNDAYLAAGGKGKPDEAGAFITFDKQGKPVSIYIRTSVMSSSVAALVVGHELLHDYSNADFRTLAQGLGLGSGPYANLYEGATELLNFQLFGPEEFTGSKDGYAAYLKSLKANDPVRNNRYSQQTLAAQAIFDRIGADTFYAAYFQGDKAALTAFENAAQDLFGSSLKEGDPSLDIAAQLQPGNQGNKVFPMPADMSRVNPGGAKNLPTKWAAFWEKVFFGRPRSLDQWRADYRLPPAAPGTVQPTDWAIETAGASPVLGRLIDMVADIHAHSRPYDYRSGPLPERLVGRIGTDGRILIGDIPQHCGTPHYSAANATSLTLKNAPLLDKTNAEAFLEIYGRGPAGQALAAKFDLSITGFNPADPNAVQYVRDTLLKYPGVFKFIGEITLEKEMVRAMLGPEAASVKDSVAMNNFKKILALANDNGLGVLIHCDWGPASNGPDLRPQETVNDYSFLLGDPGQNNGLLDLVKQFPQANIVLAHAGNGRFVRPDDTLVDYTFQNGPQKGMALKGIPKQIAMMEQILDEAPHVRFDISWNDVGEMYADNKKPLLRNGLHDFILAHPDAVLFGSDTVKPVNKGQYMQAFTTLLPFLADLAKSNRTALYKLLRGNYETIVTDAETRLANWARPLLSAGEAAGMDAMLAVLKTEHGNMATRALATYDAIIDEYNDPNRTPSNDPQGVLASTLPQPKVLTPRSLKNFFFGEPSGRRGVPGTPNTRLGAGTPYGVPPTFREQLTGFLNAAGRGTLTVGLGALFITHPELVHVTDGVVAGTSTILRNAIYLSKVFYREYGVRLPWEMIFEEGNAVDRNVDKFISRVLSVGRTLGVDESDLNKVIDLTGQFRADAGYTMAFWDANKPGVSGLTQTEWENARFINLMGVIGRYQIAVDRALGVQASSLEAIDPRTNLGSWLNDIQSLTIAINMVNLEEGFARVSPDMVASVLNETALASFLATNVVSASGRYARANWEDTNLVIRGLRVLTLGGLGAGGLANAVADVAKTLSGDPAAALNIVPHLGDAAGGVWTGANEGRKLFNQGATTPKKAFVAGAVLGISLIATGIAAILYFKLHGGSNGTKPASNPGLTPTPTPTQTPTPTPTQPPVTNPLPPTSFPTSPQTHFPGNPNPAGYNASINGLNYSGVTPGDSLWQIAKDEVLNHNRIGNIHPTLDQLNAQIWQELLLIEQANPQIVQKGGSGSYDLIWPRDEIDVPNAPQIPGVAPQAGAIPGWAVNGGEPGTDLPAGTRLNLGDHYTSPNGEYELVMQYDGDLVLYRINSNGTKTQIFDTGTYENNPNGLGVGDHAVIQPDGNLIVFGANHDGDKPGDAVWASNTGSPADAYSVLAIQNDGNLVAYAKGGATWDAQGHNINGRLVGDPAPQPPRYG